MKLTKDEIATYNDMILSANYALAKQVKSIQIESNYGEIELLEEEFPKVQKFITNMLERRIEKLSKAILK